MLNFLVDMLRLETRVDFEDIERFFDERLIFNPYVEQYLRNGIQDYRYNFKINETYSYATPFGAVNGENNFFVAYKHNSEITYKRRFNLIIEYNPNKCNTGEGLLHLILDRYFKRLAHINVKSCDVCCDMFDIGIDDVSYDLNRKTTRKDYITAKGHTIYLGERASHGQVKIYDKGAEQKTDKKWTRWETTLKLNNSITFAHLLSGLVTNDIINANLPTVYIGDNGQLGCDDIIIKCAVNAIKTGFAKLSDFTYHQRKKIKPYLADTALYTIGNKEMPLIIDAIVTYLKKYVNEFNIGEYRRPSDIVLSILNAQNEPKFQQLGFM